MGLFIRTIRPNLNIQSCQTLFNIQCLLIYSSLHYIYAISLFYFHLIMTNNENAYNILS